MKDRNLEILADIEELEERIAPSSAWAFTTTSPWEPTIRTNGPSLTVNLDAGVVTSLTIGQAVRLKRYA